MGQFGLRAEYGINKPSFYAFSLLHQLGVQRLASPSPNVIVTKTQNGDLAIAAWNLVAPDPESQRKATAHPLTLAFKGTSPSANVSIERVDKEHGNVLSAYAAMGKPAYPTPEQVEQLNRATHLPPPEITHLQNGELKLVMEPNALVLLKIMHGTSH